MLSSHEGEAPLCVSTHSKILPLPGLEQVQPFAMSSFQAGVQQHSPACSAQGTLGCPGTSHPVQTAGSEGQVSAAPCPSSEASSPRMSTRTWLDGRNVCYQCVTVLWVWAAPVTASCQCRAWERLLGPEASCHSHWIEVPPCQISSAPARHQLFCPSR